MPRRCFNDGVRSGNTDSTATNNATVAANVVIAQDTTDVRDASFGAHGAGSSSARGVCGQLRIDNLCHTRD